MWQKNHSVAARLIFTNTELLTEKIMNNTKSSMFTKKSKLKYIKQYKHLLIFDIILFE